MLLTISTDQAPATDLGYLLHKNPGRAHARELSFGEAHVVFPEASDEACTAALLVEVDMIALVRGSKRRKGPSLFDYVSDRPYTANSFLSAAIGKVYGTALSGRCKDRPELADAPLPLELHLPVVACPGDGELIEQLFGPLGWEVASAPIELDPAHPEWGASRYRSVTLRSTCRLKDALEHVYVLLPVLDGTKHYWVGADEIDRLLRRGGAWVANHPQRELIARRYLRHDRVLQSVAFERLAELEDRAIGDGAGEDAEVDPDGAGDAAEAAVERPLNLNEQRMAAVLAEVQRAAPRSVVDLGCGEGRLLGRLLKETSTDRIVGVDVSHRSLQVAARRLHLDSMAPRQRDRLDLRQGGLTYVDPDLRGFDVACLIEVIEHVEPWRLDALEHVVFAEASPARVIVTTPNVEHNVRFGMEPGRLRHADHRFEWTRAEFAAWADGVAERHGYAVAYAPIGPDDPEVGPPTQMAVFAR